MKLLLTMHRSLLNIIENNNKLGDIKNKFDNTPITKKAGGAKETVLCELLQKYLFLDKNTTIENRYPNISQELIEYFKEFLSNINKLKQGFNTYGNNNSIKTDISGYRNTISNPKVPGPSFKDLISGRRIYKSKSSKIERYPFMASVHVADEFVCAGAIIKKYFVITAASCLQILLTNKRDDSNSIDVVVRIGSDYTMYDGAVVAITKIFFHPKYNSSTLENNIALLRMDNKIRSVNKMKKVYKVSYDKHNKTLPQRILMLGWGAKNKANEPFRFQRLSHAYLDFYDWNRCKELYSSVYVTETNFCAGFTSKGGGACLKDTGDPAIIDGIMVGIVSYGPATCGTLNAPTVFTRISHYSEWIENSVKLDMVKPSLVKLVLRQPQKTTIVYPQPIAISAKFNTNKDSYHPHIRPVNDYPQEIIILREILKEIAVTNASILEEIIDESFDKEILNSIEDSTKTDLAHHPLINKSIVPVHGVHIPEEKDDQEKYQTVSLTTSGSFTYPWMGATVSVPDALLEYDAFADEFYHFKTTTVTTLTVPTIPKRKPIATLSTKYFTDMFERLRSESDDDTSDIGISNKESKEGLSIEETTPIAYDETDKLTRILSSRESEHYENADESTNGTKLYFYFDSSL
ncbi:unnamed protein product [Chilo suppressalis]|uniref:Peptidase S1 domain-containing protein n=1 Tax=Chilo suppressalis TaxID=168631 RepID=A0ABN8B6Q8_CHISP|nr:unnamed protein product [Chilo suppressalis]